MADEPWLDRDQLAAWLTLSAVLEALPASIDRQLKDDAGINLFEYTVLAMLSEQDDHTSSMRELADLAFGSLSRLSHAATRLEKRGWVTRSIGTGGRRHNVVSLTTEGLRAIESAAPAHAAHVRELLVDPLTADELAAFAAVGEKLVAAADPAMHAHLGRMIPEVIARNQA